MDVSTGFLIALGLAVATLVAARLFLAGLPLRGRATTLRFSEVGFVGVGLAVLTFHCVALFFASVAARLPGTGDVVSDIRALGTASVLWYVAPAVLVLLGLRRLLHWGAQIVTVIVLLSFGVTMLDGGPIYQHLFALFISVVALAAMLASLVEPPSRSTTAIRYVAVDCHGLETDTDWPEVNVPPHRRIGCADLEHRRFGHRALRHRVHARCAVAVQAVHAEQTGKDYEQATDPKRVMRSGLWGPRQCSSVPV